MNNQYSLGEFISNCLFLAYTKIRFPKARLVRLPFYLRGGKHLQYGEGFTTGYGCRFDLSGEGVTLVIGNNCKLNDRVHIVAHQSVIIGDNVLMASGIFISDTSHGSYAETPSSPSQHPDERCLKTCPVKIGDNVWIGEGVCILPGVEIGEGCVIGANAVVTKSFPKNTIIGGNPARTLKQWDANTLKWNRVM
ncbi:DapH/DapD/GlmU-related protein [Bifidobacterium eulemuris]|uniref:Acetyltransferase n=1 Tax=Bifidobacterium eulemuris TaxID=1765219 RepID=A0A261FXI9_9BIFI|nr:DapH/DapD/GlmU-related protein [Bifidobacterium eulemuris]OZG63900.1 acetyltransferase [Bifidobacterium eulemuris]QOL32427.1 acetyltransferase [Bifidobacterium eulemuris]